ncbi:MAG: helix-turn-helix domain-containing protein [Candidatus Rokuibacteriota bacterium]
MEWVDTQLAQDARLREAVEARLAEMRLEQHLVALREARGLSQQQVARLLGVSQPAIARLESGAAPNVELRTLLRVVTALGGRLNLSIEKPTARVVGIRAPARRRVAPKR